MIRGVAILIAVWVSSAAAAADFGPVDVRCDARSCCLCCDDYCPKSMPCVPCAPNGCCNDYCAKPMPCTAPLNYCGPNDFCPKPCNMYLPPCWPAWYSCGAPADGRQ